MLGAALGLIGTGAVYLIARMASGGSSVVQHAPTPYVPPAKAKAKAPQPAPLPVPEPAAPADIKPKAPPPPPPDVPHASVPTPVQHEAAPAPTPKVQALPPAPTPAPTPAALPVEEPEVPEEVAPIAAPAPPPDVPRASVPTPPPAATVAPAPMPQAQPSAGPPPGFDPSLARSLAAKVLGNIVASQYNYDRAQLKRFQTAAGVTADGVYGGESAGALGFYKSPAPKPLFKPTAIVPYRWASLAGATAPAAAAAPSAPAPRPSVTAQTPPQPAAGPSNMPPAGFDSAKARTMAKQVANNLTNKGASGYSRDLLKQFQTAAGIAADGIYGGGARGALIYFGVPRPPQPFFKPTTTTPYPWASYVDSKGGA